MSPSMVPLRNLTSIGQMASVSEYSFHLMSPPLPPGLVQEVIDCVSVEMGEPWLSDIRTRLTDPPEKGPNLFCLARDTSGRIVCHTWIGWNGEQPRGQGVGLLGHVVTLPAHRRKGLATKVAGLAMERFYREGGLCLLLGVTNQSAHRIYQQLGFRVVRGGPEEGESIMLHSQHSSAPDEFLCWYFSETGPVTSQATTRHNVGDISLLCLASDTKPISLGPLSLSLGNPLSAELDALNLFRLSDEGAVTSRVLLVGPRVFGLEIQHGGDEYSIFSNTFNPKQS